MAAWSSPRPLSSILLAISFFRRLRIHEKRYIYAGLVLDLAFSSPAFTFCYFVVRPVALAVSANMPEWFGFKANQWRAEEYIGFVCKFMLGMGVGFEMPVMILTLVKMGF